METESVKYFRNNDVVLRDIHSMYFLINVREKYFEGNQALIKINEVGVQIWTVIAECHEFELICNKIIRLYSIPFSELQTVKNDIREFCHNLVELGYLKNDRGSNSELA